MKYNTIILDRDGVINHVRSQYVRKSKQLNFITGSIIAIKELIKIGKKVVVASNQAGVGKGLITKNDLNSINSMINKTVGQPIDYYYCLHTKEDECRCRKPKPGLIELIKNKEKGPFVFVGDNITDITAAHAAKVQAILVKTGYGMEHLNSVSDDVFIFDDLKSCMHELKK
jgi:D-glycero-D-manno-heptose 1,7-bisphosphate phosphatase